MEPPLNGSRTEFQGFWEALNKKLVRVRGARSVQNERLRLRMRLGHRKSPWPHSAYPFLQCRMPISLLPHGFL